MTGVQTCALPISAPIRDVLTLWQGLGYNRRALNLKRAGEMLLMKHNGVFPKTIPEIDALPGIGPYTAGAIAAFGFNLPVVFIETNIRTVYLHFFFKGRTKIRDEELLLLIEQTLPFHTTPHKKHSDIPRLQPYGGQVQNVRMSPREWYNALMDYGAMLKSTVGNPNIHSAAYTKQSAFKGSRRQLRGEILRRASKHGTVAERDFIDIETEFSPKELLAELVREGFLKKQGRRFIVA